MPLLFTTSQHTEAPSGLDVRTNTRHLVTIKSWGIKVKYGCSDQTLQITPTHLHTSIFTCQTSYTHTHTHRCRRAHIQAQSHDSIHSCYYYSPSICKHQIWMVWTRQSPCARASVSTCVYNMCMCVMRLESSRTFICSVAAEEIEWGWVIWWHFHKGLHYSPSHSRSLIQYSLALSNPHIW